MARERAMKKSFQHSLEDIKEKMKEKRTKRLASALAPNRGRNGMINKNNGANNSHTILKGLQVNNKALALALEAEKERVRHGNAVILQLKREQQALFIHLILLKRKLKQQEALAASSPLETKSASASPNSARRKQNTQNLEEPMVCEASPISAESPGNSGQREFDRQVLPSTVGVRRRQANRVKRRSERVQKQQALTEDDTVARLEPLIVSPIHGNDQNLSPKQRRSEPAAADPVATEEFQHSTPEPAPRKKNNRKQTQQQQQPRTKTEPAPRRAPERGRKVERTQLKKPWENPKPRARSKSRDRSATRSKAAPAPQGNKLNTSLGFNDTFDFDCEEAVHVTPFKAKAEDNPPATPISEESLQTSRALNEAPSSTNESSPLSPSSESEDSLYVPQKSKKKQNSPVMIKVVTTRRGRPSKVDTAKENVPPQQEISVFRDEGSSPPVLLNEENKAPLHECPESSFSHSPDPTGLGPQSHRDHHGDDFGEAGLPPVSPLVEAEVMRIDNVLSNFENPPCDAPPLHRHQTPRRVTTCKRRGLGVRKAGRGLSLCDVTNLSPAAFRKFPSDARCSTPARKRRCTMVVDYKEPSLSAKLRRGDKFTDVEFLRSPIFKQKSDRRSMRKSKSSLTKQQPPLDKYNESFVGFR